MYFIVKNEIHAFTSKISVIFADMVEAEVFTTIYLLSTFKQPYCYCLINNNDLNNMKLSNIILRILQKIQKVIIVNQAYEFSIHTEFNFFENLKILIYTKLLS